MMKCICAKCGITKTKFIKGQAGGGEIAGEAVGFLIQNALLLRLKRVQKWLGSRKMVKSLDAIPYSERQWGHWLATNVINTKQKIGLGVSKN